MSGGVRHPVVASPESSRFLSLPDHVRSADVDGRSEGVTYPVGFVASGVMAGIKESGRRDVGVVSVVPPFLGRVSSAAVYTSNAYSAAPIQVSQRETIGSAISAVVANSGNANACTGTQGLVVARAMQAAAAEGLDVPATRVAVASTGIIGEPLEEAVVTDGIRQAVEALALTGGPHFLEAIMTTDRVPKACAMDVETTDGMVRLGGCAKGAGMIAPGMATMICVVTTDAALTPGVARSLLTRETGRTFNMMSVDGQMSTNDCVFFLANGASGVYLSAAGAAQFGSALRALLMRLALMMVADGEGATKVVHLRVRGATGDDEARAVARAVADSALVKTAMYGADPNWGRILCAAGTVLVGRTLPRTYLEIGGVRVVQDARAVALTPDSVRALEAHMRESEVEILLHLGQGRAHDDVYFSDLGHEYININAEYHT